jgi:hypothetical protein
MAWYEVEAAQLWALVGYTHAQIARAIGFGSTCIHKHVGRYDRIGNEAIRVWLAAGYSQAEIDAGMSRGGWSALGTRLLP